MRNIKTTELVEIIRKHKLWLAGKSGGEQADLSSADLRSANLRSADLSYADLSSANLSYADLRSADLSFAKLTDTILADINWLAYIGIVPNKSRTAYAYKMTKVNGEGPFNGGINYTKAVNFSVPKCNTDVNEGCGEGINLATLAWCLNNFTDKTHRLFMMKFNVKDAVCPVGSDGKFRVLKCSRVGECDWTGKLMTKPI